MTSNNRCGTANICDAEYLTAGSSCIIVVPPANFPIGTWWGRVEDVKPVVEALVSYLSVSAVILGRFEMVDCATGDPIYTTGREVQPFINYRVYPDTETVRKLMNRLEEARVRAAKWERKANEERERHLEVMTHLVRQGALPEEESR